MGKELLTKKIIEVKFLVKKIVDIRKKSLQKGREKRRKIKHDTNVN